MSPDPLMRGALSIIYLPFGERGTVFLRVPPLWRERALSVSRLGPYCAPSTSWVPSTSYCAPPTVTSCVPPTTVTGSASPGLPLLYRGCVPPTTVTGPSESQQLLPSHHRVCVPPTPVQGLHPSHHRALPPAAAASIPPQGLFARESWWVLTRKCMGGVTV